MFFLDIPSSYAKILGETKFQSREFPRSGWKAEGVEEEKKVGENNGQLHFVRHHVWRTQARLDQFVSSCLVMPLTKKRGKGGKFKKNCKKTILLSAEDLQYLIENTTYDAAEIAEWFR